jgi:Fe-S-cluster containining protein
MTVTFGCTSCGRCCHDLRLTLSIDEALRWIDRDGTVEILCDALPAAAEFASDDMRQYRERAFAARSGSLDIVVGLILVATFAGPCPNLQPDMRCGDYADRPNVCRIYPTEMLPGRAPNPSDKRCPAEAWASTQPAMFDDGGAVSDPVTRIAVDAANRTYATEALAKRRLAALLEIEVAALRNEGFAAFRCDPVELRAALLEARDGNCAHLNDRLWHIASASERTTAMIVDAGAAAATPSETAERYYIPLA